MIKIKEITIPYIEGDGIGSDIWKATSKVLETASKKYANTKINWLEILAGEKAFRKTNEWLPKETLEQIKKYKVAMQKTIQSKKVTYDFARLMGTDPIKCSEFADEIIKNMS